MVAVLAFQFKEAITVKIASFNINGIKAREKALMTWLEEARPDVVLMQEIKSVSEKFPSNLFEDVGYNVAVNGQKSFNGVAILTKEEAKLSSKVLPGDNDDRQARFIEVYYKKKRFICIYLPNGNPKDTEKFSYKLG